MDQECRTFVMLRDGKLEYKFEGEYNDVYVPASHSIAQRHRDAWRVSSPLPHTYEEQEVCPCCKRTLARKDIQMGDDEMALSFIGSGYPLYFNFIRCCLMIVGVLFLTSGTDCADFVRQVKHQYNSTTPHVNDWNLPVYNYCLDDTIAMTTMANKRFETTLNILPQYFNMSSVIFILVIIFFFRKSQMDIDNECDIKENTPSDYSILIKGLPIMNDPKKELTEYFQAHWDVEVSAINVVYSAEQLDQLKQQQSDMIEQLKSGQDPQEIYHGLAVIEQQIKETAAQIQMDNTQFAGQAFVSFKYEDHKQQILKDASHNVMQVAFNIIFGCIFYDSKQIEFNGHSIKVEQAPEPTDVIWQNIVQTDRRRFWVRLLGFIFSQIVIAVFLIVLLELAKIQAIASSDEHGNIIDVDTGDAIVQVELPEKKQGVHTSAIVAALITTFINSFVVDQLSRFLVRFESYETYSLYTVSLASKLSLMLFFNSAIIAFLASTFYTHNIYGPGGLIYTETYFFISNAFIPPLVNLIDPGRYANQMQIWIYQKLGKPLTQQELNQLYEHPEHAIELRYADIMKTLFITFFYAPLIPAGYITSFIGLTLYYYAEKYVLLNRQTVKHTPSIQLSILMTEMIEYLPVIFAIGSLIFRYQISNLTSTLDFIAVAIGISSSILPIQYWVEKLFPVVEQDEVTSFQEASVNFETMYDKENPVTKFNIELTTHRPRTLSQGYKQQ